MFPGVRRSGSRPDTLLEKPPGGALLRASPEEHPGLASKHFEVIAVGIVHARGHSRGMDQKDVFALALGLAGTPWKVVDIRFDTERKRLDIDLDFPPRSTFPHPDGGEPCSVYDTEQRSWRHLNFFQFECFVNAFVPRVDGGPGRGVKRVAVPWTRPQSGFTLFMEAMIVLLAQSGIVTDSAGRYAAAAADVSHRELNLVLESEDFFDLTHGFGLSCHWGACFVVKKVGPCRLIHRRSSSPCE